MPVKFAAAGRTDSPQLVRVEAMLMFMESCLESFNKHIIRVPPAQWDGWLSAECERRRWKHSGDVLIFRELVDRGGEALYMGGLDDLYEYAKVYYNMDPVHPTEERTREIVEENLSEEKRWKAIREEEHKARWPTPAVLCVTAASSTTAHYILQHLLCTDFFPPGMFFGVNLLAHNAADMNAAKDVVQDMEDCASHQLQWVRVVLQPEKAFENADYVIIVEQPRRANGDAGSELAEIEEEDEAEEEVEWVEVEAAQNKDGHEAGKPTLPRFCPRPRPRPLQAEPSAAQISMHIDYVKKYSNSIKANGKPGVRVIIAGRYATATAQAVWDVLEATPSQQQSHSGKPQQVLTMASLREQRVKTLMSKKLNIRPQNVSEVVMWGDLDVPCHLTVKDTGWVYRHVGGISCGPADFRRRLEEVTPSGKAIFTKVLPQVVKEHRVQPDSAVATGKAVADVLRPYLWWPQEVPVKYKTSVQSVGLVSEGQYGVPAGTVFGLPAKFDMHQGRWTVEEDLNLDDEAMGVIRKEAAKLREEFKKLSAPDEL